jgi:hypothetical protein
VGCWGLQGGGVELQRQRRCGVVCTRVLVVLILLLHLCAGDLLKALIVALQDTTSSSSSTSTSTSSNVQGER